MNYQNSLTQAGELLDLDEVPIELVATAAVRAKREDIEFVEAWHEVLNDPEVNTLAKNKPAAV